jgi:outer membrane protein
MLVAATVLGLASPAAAETIEQALARAYANNPQLNAQRAIVRQADEGVPQALSGYRPNVSANASVGREYTDIKQIIPPTPPLLTNSASFAAKGLSTPRSVGATVSQTLFNGQQTANRVRTAESQVAMARETLRVMEQSVLLAAATIYMDISRDSANLEVQQNNVRVLQRTLTDTRNRFAAGQVTDTDVAQSEAQLAAAEAISHGAESTLTTTRANYRRIIGSTQVICLRSPRSSGSRLRRSRPRLLPARRRTRPSSRLCTVSMSRSCRSRSPKARCFPRSRRNTTCNTACFRSF